jgi:hypothetical protein
MEFIDVVKMSHKFRMTLLALEIHHGLTWYTEEWISSYFRIKRGKQWP